MQLCSMHLQNFRCFTKIDVTFDPKLTVVVGFNGCGKTAVLEAAAIFLKHLHICQSCSKDMPITYMRIGSTLTELDYTVQLDKKNYPISFKYQKALTSAIDADICKRNSCFLHALEKRVLPIIVYYSASREIDKYQPERSNHVNSDAAYKNAFESCIDFSSTLTWFIEKSAEEALEAVHKKNLEHRIAELSAVRSAVSKALGDYNEPYVADTPPKLFITRRDAHDTPLSLEQLSDGYRTMLALVMDLARRMALVSSTEKNILETPGIVLIDEIELHLHPAWQQTILPRLMEIFPHVQFIVTTNSPQVLSSILDKHIRILRTDGMVYSTHGTWGAETSRILKQVLGVDNRPPSQARDELEEYRTLVYNDTWDSERALELRKILDARYADQEPELTNLDMYIANRKWEINGDEVCSSCAILCKQANQITK